VAFRARIVVLALAGTLLLTGIGVGLLYLAPAIVLLALLAAGYVPGERRLVEAVERRRARPAIRRSALAAPRPRRVRVVIARGSALLSCGLAVRPPPAARAAT
jgi:hypothetical protein